MHDINRCLVVVKPKQPMLDWIHSQDEERYTLEEIRRDNTAYLVSEWELDSDQQAVLEHYYDLIFEAELWSWYTEESMWPEQRDFTTFREWFDVEFHSLIFDLVAAPLEHIGATPESDIDAESNGH